MGEKNSSFDIFRRGKKNCFIFSAHLKKEEEKNE